MPQTFVTGINDGSCDRTSIVGCSLTLFVSHTSHVTEQIKLDIQSVFQSRSRQPISHMYSKAMHSIPTIISSDFCA